MNEPIPEEKFDELISNILAVRAAHQIQTGVVAALIAAVEERASERDKELEELHERSTGPRH